MKAGFEDKHELPTDVILVVKGAGEQKLDATLDAFLSGFLKAVRSYDAAAIVNVGLETKILKDYNYASSFKDEESEQNIVEIILEDKEKPEEQDQTTETKTLRRIWIKEAYWEQRLGTPGAFRSLLHEWRLTSYALIKLIEKVFYPWQDDWTENEAGGHSRKYHPRNAHKHSSWAYFMYYLLTYAIVFLFLNFIGVWGNPLIQSVLEIPRLTGSLHPLFTSPVSHLIFLTGLAIWAALASALRARHNRDIEQSTGLLPRMPGLSNWLLFALVAALFLEPVSYFAWLIVYAFVFVVSNLLARRIAWDQRADFSTDAPLQYEADEEEQRLYRKHNRISLGSQLFYRVLVTLALPLVVTMLALSKVFLLLNIFGDLGTRINTSLINLIIQTVGDVTAYAIDPAAASRVQNVVEEEIRTFANLTPKDIEKHPPPGGEVINNIHVFAHSQGTPITFEVLIHKLPEKLLKKVNTYITIGSVLNLHHLVNEVLDDNFWSRFPPVEYPELHESFKWFNFWNFTDPITQFTGLEAYRQDVLWVKKDGELRRYHDGTARVDYSKASPFSIKTRDSILKNHSEYWGNAEEIHTPFLKRIFHKKGTNWIPDAWASEEIKFKHANRQIGGWNMNLMNVANLNDPALSPESKRYSRQRRKYFWWFSLSWLAISLLAGLFFYFAGSALAFWLNEGREGFVSAINGLGFWLGGLLPDGAAQALADLWRSISAYYLDQDFVNLLGFVLLIWAILSGLFQIIPTLGPPKRPESKAIAFFDPEKAVEKLKERWESK